MSDLANEVNEMSEKVKQVDAMVHEGDMLLAGANLYVTSLIESQKEERMETQRLHAAQLERLSVHWRNAFIALSIVFALFIAGVVGTIAYFMTNYDIAFGYVQDLYVGGDGNPTINDGIHFNAD